MSKHTPGPWEIAEDDTHGQAVVRGEHIEIATCWHHCVGSIEKEMRANARLIAAVPDLLEALKDMNSGWKYIRHSYGDLYGVGWDRAQEKADAAIAKAQGDEK